VPLSASKIIVLQKLHIGGVFDKSAHRPSAPPTRECLGAQTVAAHPGRRIGAGPPGWGTSETEAFSRYQMMFDFSQKALRRRHFLHGSQNFTSTPAQTFSPSIAP